MESCVSHCEVYLEIQLIGLSNFIQIDIPKPAVIGRYIHISTYIIVLFCCVETHVKKGNLGVLLFIYLLCSLKFENFAFWTRIAKQLYELMNPLENFLTNL